MLNQLAVCEHCGSGACLVGSKLMCRHTGHGRDQSVSDQILSGQKKAEQQEAWNKKERKNNAKNHSSRRR